jgi:hypothetical protein
MPTNKAMNSNDYHTMLRILRGKKPRNTEHLKQLERKVSPFLKRLVSYAIENKPLIIDNRFLRRNVENKTKDQKYVNALFLNFFIHVGINVMDEKTNHLFFFPHTNVYECQRRLFAQLFLSVFTLLFNKVEWSLRDFLALEETMTQFFDGRVEALRKLMTSLGRSDFPLVDYETYMSVPHQIYPYLWGPLVWGMIHFMAESFTLRADTNENVRFAKNSWMSFTRHSLYRCLPCGFCMQHYQTTIKNYNLEDEGNYVKIWFDIHNDINEQRANPRHSEGEFSKDREFIRDVLNA